MLGHILQLKHDGVVPCRVEVFFGFTCQISFSVLPNKFLHVCRCGLLQPQSLVRRLDLVFVHHAGINIFAKRSFLLCLVRSIFFLPHELFDLGIAGFVPQLLHHGFGFGVGYLTRVHILRNCIQLRFLVGRSNELFDLRVSRCIPT